MKKLTAVLLSLALSASLCVTAFAAAGTATKEAPATQEIEVDAKYSDTTETPDVYSVEVAWGKMEFTFEKSGSRIWNADSHTFSDSTTAAWNADGNDVTVTNHSNKEVNVAFAFTKDSTISDALTGTFNIPAKTLAAGVEGKRAEADQVTALLTLSGALSASRTNLTKVGSVTVTLSK